MDYHHKDRLKVLLVDLRLMLIQHFSNKDLHINKVLLDQFMDLLTVQLMVLHMVLLTLSLMDHHMDPLTLMAHPQLNHLTVLRLLIIEQMLLHLSANKNLKRLWDVIVQFHRRQLPELFLMLRQENMQVRLKH